MIKIIDCPRDAMQGWEHFIPTHKKVEYLNSLLQVGFDTLDFGSFVSPKAIPQMADTREVLSNLDLSSSKTKLLAIVANLRGAEEAVAYDEITYIGFPFSISETFQQRNTHSSIADSLITVNRIQELCIRNHKQLVVYISMAFGNPYGDAYSPEVASHWVSQMVAAGIKIIALSDTIGIGNPENIGYLFKHLIPEFSAVEIGAHLHTTPETWLEKVEAAYSNGCLRFDGALKGYGGCPMAADKLTGNMPTENLVKYFTEKQLVKEINQAKLLEASNLSSTIFI